MFRYAIAAFLIFWLCGWAFGLLAAGKELLSGHGPRSFLIPWLAVWTLGGVFAGMFLYLLLRPQSPESVMLGHDEFVYDTGSAAPVFFYNPAWMFRHRNAMTNPFSLLFQKRKTYAMARSECPEFVLEGIGEEQRLRFDSGVERVVIGESLSEPEREWLAGVLQEWREGKDAL
jgi:hypothetical protein